ncbi:S1C family serine protease [Candidatus Solirubrobacter pratensis]|uniref:S1C family serine protease n=1 Tax=Candidatus Solirubrobacter pratensis TaxID=1298857 RepID=UPI0009DB843D|nr:trypsin-like peptidase domain-containing protein [Candidatus Solirubrobacter pratensis]
MNQVLEAIQEAVAGVAERVGPAVVGLGRGWARGSGVVIGEGRVLTAAHVLRGDEATVTFADGRIAAGRVLGADTDLDVAVVETETGDAPVVEWDADAVVQLSVGTPVLALANPGGHGLRTTFGLVTATGRSFRGPRGRRIPGSIEHSAPLPRGSSGGPLVDSDGRLLGLNAVRREGGLILAVPADDALRRRVDALARGEAAERPRLGVALAHPRSARKLRAAVGLPERDGVLVRGVVDDSPAARAGIERGDLIVAAAGKDVAAVDDLFDALDGAPATVTLRLVRGAEERDVEVALG